MRVLEKKGAELIRISGSHHSYRFPGSRDLIVIPLHMKGELDRGLFYSLVKRAGLTDEDFE